MTTRTATTFCALSLLAAGCSEVVPTTAHAPSNPAHVEIYDSAPRKYETLGEVTIVVVGRWDDQANANNGFDRLRQAAAARGANGILLDPDAVHGEYDVVVGDRGTFHAVPMRGTTNRTAVVEAIYVIEK